MVTYAGRALAGIGAGAASLYVPRYISEVAPISIRGGLATLNQVPEVFSASVCLNSRVNGSHDGRRHDFHLGLHVMPAVQCCSHVVQSPVELMALSHATPLALP